MKSFMNKIICGDAAEVLKKIPAGTVRLTVTSPPYDNLRDYEGFEFSFEKIARELYRVTVDGGVVVWVVGDGSIHGEETGTSFVQVIKFRKIGFRLHDTMIYQKVNSNYIPNICHKRFVQSFEYMFVLSKGVPEVFNPLFGKSLKYPNEKPRPKTTRSRDGKIHREMRAGNMIPGHKLLTNVWRMKSSTSQSDYERFVRTHPATFPEELAKRHILTWSNPGDLILDPMCGSGTTLKVAHELRRKFIGIEISKKYCRLARQRIRMKRR